MELTDKFSLANALTLVLASQAAYTATPTIRNEKTDTSVVITEEANHVVVTFPGTRDFADVLKDLECWREPFVVGVYRVEMHKGFCDAFESVKNEIAAELGRLHSFQCKPIFVAGHSKGGALATRCAAFLQERYLPFAALYTYGEPRGGNAAYAAYCRQAIGDAHFRLEHAADCITRLPGWLAGNRHSGHDVFLNADGSYEMDPVLSYKAWCDWREIENARNKGPLALLALGLDHHIANYVRALQVLNQRPITISA